MLWVGEKTLVPPSEAKKKAANANKTGAEMSITWRGNLRELKKLPTAVIEHCFW